MVTYETLLQEYQEYLNEKKTLAAIAGSAALAVGGAHFLDKDAEASIPLAASDIDPLQGEGDWFNPETPSGAVDTPTDHPDDVKSSQASKSVDFNKADLDVLSMTLWGEARGEGADGMRAVAHVIVNRAKHPSRWKDTVRGVSREGSQFSCWNSNDVNSSLMPKMLEFYNYLKAKPPGWQQWYSEFQQSPDFPKFQKYLEARKIAREVLQGRSKDPTNGALFYHTGAVSPSWAQGQKIVAKIGAHQFYRTDRKA